VPLGRQKLNCVDTAIFVLIVLAQFVMEKEGDSSKARGEGASDEAEVQKLRVRREWDSGGGERAGAGEGTRACVQGAGRSGAWAWASWRSRLAKGEGVRLGSDTEESFELEDLVDFLLVLLLLRGGGEKERARWLCRAPREEARGEAQGERGATLRVHSDSLTTQPPLAASLRGCRSGRRRVCASTDQEVREAPDHGRCEHDARNRS
jgi:hypothetical protein